MKIGQTALKKPKNSQKRGYEPIPKGQYLASLGRIEEVTTKDGTGTYLNASFEILEGEFKKRLVFHKFHIENKSSKCQEIGVDQLDKFLKCAGERDGLAGIDWDTARVEGFIGKPLAINVGMVEAEGEYAARNKVSSFAVR